MSTALEYLVSKIEGNPSKDNNILVESAWFSESEPKYPLDLEFVLRRKSNIEKIQITCHNTFIPSSLQVLTEDGGNYKNLGNVQFKEKKSSATKHEVKTIYMDEVCTAVTFRIGGCHQSQDNPERKVGLMEVKFLGQTIPESEEHPLFKPINDKAKVVIVKDQKYTKEMEELIANVERNKNKSVADENFHQAKKAQLALRLLAKAKIEMSELEKDKNEAIEEEDYQRAFDLTEEMKTLRANVLAAVDDKLIAESGNEVTNEKGEDDVYKPRNLFDEDPLDEPPRRPQLFTPVDLSPTRVDAPIDVDYLLPPRPPSSRSARRSRDSNKLTRARTAYRPSSTEPTERKASPSRRRSDSHMIERRGSTDSNTSTASIETLKVHKTRKLSSRGVSGSQVRATNKFMEKENMIVPAALRGRSGSDFSLDNEETSETSSITEEQLLASIPHQDKHNVSTTISHFGLKTISKVYSKNWEKRKQGLAEVKSKLEAVPTGKKTDYLESAIFILSKATKDSLYNVYTSGLGLLEYVACEYMPRHDLMKMSGSLASSTYEQLCIKAAETNNDKRIPKDTLQTFSMIIKSDEIFARAYLTRIFASDSTKIEKGRCHIIHEATEIIGLPREQAGLSESALRKWSVHCLKNSDAEVRNIGRKIFLQLYEKGDRRKARNSLSTEISNQKSPMYRTILDEMDKMDRAKY